MKKLILFSALIILFSCSKSDDGNNNPNPTPEPVLTSLQISSSNGSQLDLNGTSTTQLAVSGKDQFNQAFAIVTTVQWSANNNNVNIDQNGNVTAQSVGNSIVTAETTNVSATFSISVVDTTPQTGIFFYVSDAGNFNNPPWKIMKFDENGQNPEIFINQGLAWPQDIVFLENENEVLISNLNSGIINRHDASTGALINSFANGISGPTRMKIGPDNLLYVLQWTGNGRVLRYQLDGSFVDEFTDVGVSQSIGLDWDSNGNLYVSSFDGAIIRKFDVNGDDLGIVINSNLQGPTNLWFDTNGNIIVNDWTGDRVVKFDANGNFIENIISSGIDQPEGIAVLPNGDYVIGSGGTSEVKRYNANGDFLGNLVNAGAGGLLRPNAVVRRELN